jgi:hypothetical protein
MHRSGTSALAGLFNILGCKVPANPMPASKANARGFFESTAVRDFNDELLGAAGSSWDDLTRFHDDWLRTPEAEEFLDRAVSVLEAEFGNAKLFVLKDPRICRLVPFWTAALERFGCAVKPVLTIRNPLEVGRSLFTKRRLSEPLGQMLWLRHVLDAERATRGMERFNTSFEQLMLHWDTVAAKAQEALQIVWPKPLRNVEREVELFLSDELRHVSKAASQVSRSSILPDWLRESYAILSRWAEDAESADDYQALDRIDCEFDAASAAFLRVARGERDATLEQMNRAQALEASGSAREAELKSVVGVLTKERDELKSQLEKARDQRSGDEKQRKTVEAQLAAIQTTLAQGEAVRHALEARVVALDESLRNRKAANESKEAALMSTISESEAARKALEQSLQEQSAADDRNRKEFESSLTRSEAAREALQRQLAEASADHERVRDNLARAAELREMLQGKLAELEESLEGQKVEFQSQREELHARLAEAAVAAERHSGEIKKSLQESRREATLLKAEVHQLKEERENLLSELSASRDRRKEAARVIARRDAEIEARYRELAALELHMLRSSLAWKLTRLFRFLRQRYAPTVEPGPTARAV